MAILATASVAQLAEHRTRFAGSRVRFAAGRPKLHFRNRSRLGLKSRGIWVLYISFNICKTTIKHSKEGANMFLYTVYIYIYIYIYKGKNSIFYLDVFILISSLVWFLIDLREVTPKGWRQHCNLWVLLLMAATPDLMGPSTNSSDHWGVFNRIVGGLWILLVKIQGIQDSGV